MGKTTIMLSRLESITIYPHMQYGLGLAENITYEVHWFLNCTLSCKTWRKLPIMSNNSVAIIYEISQTMNVAASLSFTKSILAIYIMVHIQITLCIYKYPS